MPSIQAVVIPNWLKCCGLYPNSKYILTLVSMLSIASSTNVGLPARSSSSRSAVYICTRHSTSAYVLKGGKVVHCELHSIKDSKAQALRTARLKSQRSESNILFFCSVCLNQALHVQTRDKQVTLWSNQEIGRCFGVALAALFTA